MPATGTRTSSSRTSGSAGPSGSTNRSRVVRRLRSRYRRPRRPRPSPLVVVVPVPDVGALPVAAPCGSGYGPGSGLVSLWVAVLLVATLAVPVLAVPVLAVPVLAVPVLVVAVLTVAVLAVPVLAGAASACAALRWSAAARRRVGGRDVHPDGPRRFRRLRRRRRSGRLVLTGARSLSLPVRGRGLATVPAAAVTLGWSPSPSVAVPPGADSAGPDSMRGAAAADSAAPFTAFADGVRPRTAFGCAGGRLAALPATLRRRQVERQFAIRRRGCGVRAPRPRVGVVLRSGRAGAVLAGRDRGHQIALAHAGGAADAELTGERLQIGQHHARQSLAAASPSLATSRRCRSRGCRATPWFRSRRSFLSGQDVLGRKLSQRSHAAAAVPHPGWARRSFDHLPCCHASAR